MKVCIALALAICLCNFTLPVNAASVSSGDLLMNPGSTVQSSEGVQIMDVIDYSEDLQVLQDSLDSIQISLDALFSNQVVSNELITYLAGFGLFAVIVLLCYFGYKFFRIFI